MPTRTIGIVIDGATGRLGTTQHLRALLAIAGEGGLPLANGDRLMPQPLLLGRDAEKLAALAGKSGGLKWSTERDSCLADPVVEAFSSRGPTTDGRPKPELAAPDRTATVAYGATATGTSFASPVVAGAAALLAQEAPGISANQIRAALVGAAHDVGSVGRDADFGYGQLVAAALALPLDSDGDSQPDATDPCPFAANDVCLCGDVDGSSVVASLDEAALRLFLSNPSGPNPGFARPELCNVVGAAAPFPLDCRIDDWVVMRRARAALGPGIQPVCAPALPP